VNPLAWTRAEILHLAWQHGWYTPPDRTILKRDILAELAASDDVQRVLFVGVSWYTAPYSEMFRGKTFATIDPKPSVAKFGGNPHAVDGVQNLRKHMPDLVFDAIILSGVIGFGLNNLTDVDEALSVCADSLRTGGWLVLGINENTPAHVDPARSVAAKRFAPRPFGKIMKERIDVKVPFRERRHTFLFWQKL
jgi:hypothetical protein